jgi:hypothetical protein
LHPATVAARSMPCNNLGMIETECRIVFLIPEIKLFLWHSHVPAAPGARAAADDHIRDSVIKDNALVRPVSFTAHAYYWNLAQ